MEGAGSRVVPAVVVVVVVCGAAFLCPHTALTMDVKYTFVLLFLSSIVGMVNSTGETCNGNPFKNGGTCTKESGQDQCECTAQYTGKHCTVLIAGSQCDPNPCQNGGTCTHSIDGFTCACASGYTGVECDEAVMPCDSEPCQNGGTCSNVDEFTYTCSCPEGFTGDQCGQQAVTPCDSEPCQNGGTCNEDESTYTCSCPEGYTGDQCEQVLTAGSSACNSCPLVTMTTTTTVHVNQPAQCSGVTCHKAMADPCASNPCQNKGTCTSTACGSYSCTCPNGYTGQHCENGGVVANSP